MVAFQPMHHGAALKIPKKRAARPGGRHPLFIRRNGDLLQVAQSELTERLGDNVGPCANCEDQAGTQQQAKGLDSLHETRGYLKSAF